MRLRVYLDTSVISVLDDDRSPERRDMTREFWARLSEFDASTSEATRREVLDTPAAERRDSMLASLGRLTILPVTAEAEALAAKYMAAGIFSQRVAEDALHVAVAVLARQDILVSWNFKHLVNQRRRGMIDALNLSLALPTIRILPPPEV
jgi:predicted nucleic acid-binding protein